MKIAIKAKTVYNNQLVNENQILLIEDGILTDINAKEIPSGFKTLEADIVCPGFLDVQVYGAGNSLFSSDLSHQSLEIMEAELIKQGCTGFFATLATNTDEVFYKAIEVAKTYQPKVHNFLGLHLEGPFINPKKRGAHIADYVKVATIGHVKRIIEVADGVVKMITIAPELQSAEVLEILQKAGIIISAGHSMATFEEGNSFFDQVSAATHLFNAMPALHHREPGLVGAIFSKKPYTSIVADGIHVDFEMVKMAKKLLGERLFLITDAVTECKAGPYQHILKNDKYVMPDGTLSGSSLTLLKAVKNCINKVDIDISEALRMASAYPAQLIGNENYGNLTVGSEANCLLMDEGLNLSHVILKNNIY